MRSQRRPLLGPLLVLGTLLALVAAVRTPTPALAAPKTWQGLSDANWTNPANWGGFVAPVAGDDLVFPAGALQLTNTNDFPDGTGFNSITIQGSGYTLNGKSVTIANGQSITASHPGGTTSTINLPVAGNGTGISVANTGAILVFGGSLTNGGSFGKSGTGTAVLLAPGSATAGWIVSAGILSIQNGGTLGAGGVANPGGTLQVQGGITVPARIILNGSTGAANATGAVESVSGNNTLTGGIILNNDNTISADVGATLTVSTTPVNSMNPNQSLTVNALGTVNISSVVQGAAGTALTKTGAGTLTLSANNTYAGPTTVNAGTLLVNGIQPTSSVTVASGATLGGTGTTGPVTVNGTVSPGVGGPDVLHTGSTMFNAGSTFAVDLNGPTAGGGYDELSVTGTATLLGPTLNVSVGFSSATGNTYMILQSTGALSGTFAGLPEGSTFVSGGRTFRINYTPSAVTLTDVTPTPTPTTTPTPTATSCILGDINCDGIVDIRDYGIWRQQFGQQGAGIPADLNQDGIVDIRDYGIWRANFGHTAGAALRGETAPAPRGTPGPALLGSDRAAAVPSSPRQPDGCGQAVPVIPLVGGLLGLGGLAGWRRRRPPRGE